MEKTDRSERRLGQMPLRAPPTFGLKKSSIGPGEIIEAEARRRSERREERVLVAILVGAFLVVAGMLLAMSVLPWR